MKTNRGHRPARPATPGWPARPPHGPKTLRTYWARWTEVVALYALGRQGRRRVDPRAYQDLHRLLVEACHELKGSADATPHDYAKMEALVRPWMSPKVLAQTDREILGDLLGQCRLIERELGGRGHEVLKFLRNSLLFATAVAACFCLAWYARGALPSVANLLWDWMATARLMAGRVSAFESSFVLGLVLILASIYLVSRAARD